MIKKFGITFGGLQQKILNLVLIFVLLIIGLFVTISLVLSNDLSRIVEESAKEQKASISQVSEGTMQGMLDSSMTQSVGMQANIANTMFADARSSVQTLQEYAQYLFTHRSEFQDKPVDDPKPENEGTPSVQLQHEAAVDPKNDKDLGLIANMSEYMLSMYKNSTVLNSCFIATTNGTIIFVDDRAGANFDENGVLQTFEVRSRPWYTGAVEQGKLFFTGVELDAFTDIPGLVCAAPVYVNGKLVAVVGADVFLDRISEYVKSSASGGALVSILNENGEVLFSSKDEGTFKTTLSSEAVDLRQSENKALGSFLTKAQKESTPLEIVPVDGEDYYLCGAPMEAVGWTVLLGVQKSVSDIPAQTLLTQYDSINEKAMQDYAAGSARSQRSLLIWTVILLILATIGALTVAGRIVKPIEHMTTRIGDLSGNDLAFEMEDAYKTGDEIEVLAQAFATLSRRTRDYISQITEITAEKERISTELELATRIQADMLPNVFPAFPERQEFDIFATMTPAKEVGGDFYDFFLIDEDHLGIVMADVSGKGVPAALFMMMSKILANNYAMMGGNPAKVLEQVNAQICKNNEEEMFVTVWFGVMTISTGKVVAANAGHEYPIIRKPDGNFELYKDRHGFVIGGMDGMQYKEYEFMLERGGTLFLYTDGVAEATNAHNELFGTDRMLEALNQDPDADPKSLLRMMRQSVDAFVGEAPQFDDLTMLALKRL